MKPVTAMTKESFRKLEPCLHGADTFEAAGKTGFKREKILVFVIRQKQMHSTDDRILRMEKIGQKKNTL